MALQHDYFYTRNGKRDEMNDITTVAVSVTEATTATEYRIRITAIE